MRSSFLQRLTVMALCLAGLAGCESANLLDDPLQSSLPQPTATSWKDGTWEPQTAAADGGAIGGVERPHFDPVVSRGTGQFLKTGELYAPAQMLDGSEGLTLNILNVPIKDAAKTVLGDILGLNYVISDKVTGTVTLQTTTAIPRETLAKVFEAALNANGAAVVQSQGFYRILPSQEASRTALVARRSQGPPIGKHVRAVPMRYVSATEMSEILKPMAPEGAIVHVDDARNIIVLAGTARELDDLDGMIELFDVDWMDGMSVALYPVKTSDPEAIATELETIFGLDEDGPLRGTVRFVPNQRLGSVLVIAKQVEMLDKARAWIRKLDKAAEQGEEQLFVYKIQNRPAVELADVLQRVLSDETSTDNDALDLSTIAPRYEGEAVSSRPDPTATPLSRTAATTDSTRTLGANRKSSGDRRTNARSHSFRVGAVKIVADEANNALIVQSSRKEYDRILRILRRLDALPTQVMLEAVIAEVSLNDELRFGVKWYLQKGKHSFTLSDAADGAVQSVFPGFSYFFAASNVQVVLDALSDITKVNVVSAPSLMVMDNRKAMLQIGDQVPIITQSAQSVTNPDAPIVNAVELKDTGVILAVTPRVNDSGRVVLEVEQEVSNVVRTTTSGIDSPTIEQRRITTTVGVEDGEVVALGGLIAQRDVTTKSQVPILGNIPVIGTAFRSKEDSIDRTELIIFIRPRVVRDTVEAQAVTEEYRSRLSFKSLQPTRGERHYRRDVNRIVR